MHLAAFAGVAALAGTTCAPAAELTGNLSDEVQLARAFAESPDDRALMLAYARFTRDPLLKRALEQRYERSAVHTAKLTTIRTEAGAEMGAAVRVQLDGREELLLVDTGAHGITLAPGRTRSGGTPIESAVFGGRLASTEATAARVALGDLVLPNVPIRIAASKLPGGIDGIIGTDVFSEFRVRLDYVRGQLVLTGDRSTGGGWRRLLRSGHLLLVSAREGTFLFDTGAAVSVIDRPSAGPARILRGAAGDEVTATSLGLACVAVESSTLCDPDAVAMDMAKLRRDGTNIAGLIGYGAIKGRVVEIDYRSGRIRFGD
jgi:hypothetical protein